MKLIKRTLTSFVLITLIAIAGYTYSQRTTIAKNLLSKHLNMDVQLEDLWISPIRVTLTGFVAEDREVRNHYDFEYLSITFPPWIWLQTNKHFYEIELRDANMIVVHSRKSLIEKGLNLFKKSKPEKNSDTYAFTIDTIYATNLQLQFQNPTPPYQMVKLPSLPKMTLHHISGDHAENLRSILDLVTETLIEKGFQ